jgi:glycosyltransferase involved in cell wall biosynthesis
MTAPRAIGMQLAWATFRRLPLGAQRAVDRIRTARRSRQQTDHVLGTWMTPATSQWVARTLERLRPEAVLFNTVFMVPDSLTLPSSVRFRAVISHDVVHERAENFRAAGHRVHPADFSAEQEADRLATVGTVVAIQWDDARSLAALAPRARVVVSPVVVDAVPAPADARVPQRCLFVGSGSLHNVEALTWFLRECWPTVVRRRPGSELHVVGTVCARVGGVPEGVVLRGEVDSLTEEYGQAAAVVAPLRTGSGLKVKVVEAMCHGVATVTTSVGAQGLGGVWPRPYLLADTAEGFAHEVITLLTDDVARQQVEAAALSAAPLFSAAEAYAEIDQLLVEAEIVPPGRRTEEPACVPVR